MAATSWVTTEGSGETAAVAGVTEVALAGSGSESKTGRGDEGDGDDRSPESAQLAAVMTASTKTRARSFIERRQSQGSDAPL
jgi:hypothetical protein